jgi:autotransporter-associated beta strand protein
LTGNIDVRGTLRKTGDGMLTLRGTNTNTGGTAINGSVLKIDAYSRLGATSGEASFESPSVS